MRKHLTFALVMALGMASPALAYDAGGLISMQHAINVATQIGVVAVSETQFSGDEWQIEGRDIYGRHIEVDVDALTGEVRNVDR
ncbi:MAG: PepSY domain-containing protein [Xanthobacteraceae bacterium]|nr:PepSY domain-containing protein [Xanthobacteraceae bacterium]